MDDRREVLSRRGLLAAAVAAGVAVDGGRLEVAIPVRQVLDGRAEWAAGQVRWFHKKLWAEAAGDLLKCGVRLQTTITPGGVERPPGREPILSGLERGVLNFVITNRIPMQWDQGRALCGVTAIYRGYHMCMVALNRAHGHQIPFLSVNSCVHELLHALLGDILERRPGGVDGELREARIDFLATRLWLFGEGSAVRQAAERYAAISARALATTSRN